MIEDIFLFNHRIFIDTEFTKTVFQEIVEPFAGIAKSNGIDKVINTAIIIGELRCNILLGLFYIFIFPGYSDCRNGFIFWEFHPVFSIVCPFPADGFITLLQQ